MRNIAQGLTLYLRDNVSMFPKKKVDEAKGEAELNQTATAIRKNMYVCPTCQKEESKDTSYDGILVCPECGYPMEKKPIEQFDVVDDKELNPDPPKDENEETDEERKRVAGVKGKKPTKTSNENKSKVPSRHHYPLHLCEDCGKVFRRRQPECTECGSTNVERLNHLRGPCEKKEIKEDEVEGEVEGREDEDEFYVEITDGGKKAVVRIYKEGGKWYEDLEDGDNISGVGGKRYMSYLEPDDIVSWLRRDYDSAKITDTPYVDDWDDEDEMEESKNVKEQDLIETYDHSSIQVNLPSLVAKKIKELGEKILGGDLFTDGSSEYDNYGREDDPHITVRYGASTTDPDDVKPAFEGIDKVEVKLGEMGTFTNSPDYDVVKVEVESEDLESLNKALGEAVDFPGETYKDYKPHITIAYVKKGLGEKYVGTHPLAGKKIVFDSVVFSGKDGVKTNIPFDTDESVLIADVDLPEWAEEAAERFLQAVESGEYEGKPTIAVAVDSVASWAPKGQFTDLIRKAVVRYIEEYGDLEEAVKEAEETLKVLGSGIEKEEDANALATRTPGAEVTADTEDEQKFMVVVKEQ